MQADELKAVLKKWGIRATKIRTAVLAELMHRNYSVSLRQVEERLGGAYDRSSVFRALQLFEEQELIHKVPQVGGANQFAINPGVWEAPGSEQHVHFLCTRCERTYCLYEIPLPRVPKETSAGRAEEVELLVKGLCNECAQA